MKQALKVTVFLAVCFSLSAVVYAQNTDALFIAPSGNVGIGTTDPKNKLQVAGNLHMDGNTIYLRQNASDTADKIRWNSSTDQLNIAGWHGVTLGYTSGGNSITNVLTASEAGVKDKTGYITPKGGIILWNGAVSFFEQGKGKPGTDVEGWAICDGRNGTPNLQDRFVIGAGKSYGVGNTGGEAKHTLSVAEMPSHNHRFNTGAWFNFGLSNDSWKDGDGRKVICENGTQGDVNNVIVNTGGGTPFNVLPPYYALLYIMKL